MIIKFVKYRVMDKIGEEKVEKWNYISLDKEHTKACCDKMQKCVNTKKGDNREAWELEIHSYRNEIVIIRLSNEDYDNNESDIDISYCPFCGEKIEYEQIKTIQKISEKICKEIKETRCQIQSSEEVEMDLTESKK